MACNNSTTVYWSGISFDTSPQIYTDSNLTIIAPDGWYSVGGTFREMSGGLLGPPQACPACLVPCGGPINGNGGQGQYRINMDLGNDTGAALIFFSPQGVPDRVTWTYDGLSASEYSHVTFGYLQGLIGAETGGASGASCGPVITNAAGSGTATYAGTIFDYITGAFVNQGTPITMGPYNPQGSAINPVDLVGSFAAGWGAGFGATMVIPKPNITPTNLLITIDGPCGTTGWDMRSVCPLKLNAFRRGVDEGACCIYTAELYTASVYDFTGVSNVVQLNDWAFEDINGVTKIPEGIYPVDNNGTDSLVTVSADGIVTNIAACTCVEAPCPFTAGILSLIEYIYNPLTGTGEFPTGANKWRATVNVGATTGAVIVVFNTSLLPQKCTWTYDGVSKSEYSNVADGFLQGLVGPFTGPNPPGTSANSCSPLTLSNQDGSNGGTVNGNPSTGETFDWNGTSWSNSVIPVTLGPYANEASGGTTFTAAGPGDMMMVVPKPAAGPDTVDIVIESPCHSTIFTIQVYCPISLNAFDCVPTTGTGGVACSSVPPYTDLFFTASVHTTTGVSTSIQVNDWAFEDINGVTKKPLGNYVVNNNGSVDCIRVTTDGIVIMVTPCAGGICSDS
mgnify:CR=1 FL=1